MPRRKKNRRGKIGVDESKKSAIISFAQLQKMNQVHLFMTRSGIEVVITSTIGNRVAAETARGFESLPLRQKNSKAFALEFFVFLSFWMGRKGTKKDGRAVR